MIQSASIYLLFFFSGLSALIYQVLWVRSFSLIFGASHMAVTTVLAVFMGGLALGGYLGRHTDRNRNLLRLYGKLEIGIGFAALLLVGILQVYPDIYIAFARVVGNQELVLTFGRLLFAIIALLIPTTMMGLTLPVLAGFINRRGGGLGGQLAWLYGVNTLGAVTGALLAGFFLLRYLTMISTYSLAIGISLLVGLLSLVMARGADKDDGPAEEAMIEERLPDFADQEFRGSARMILFGIGISGFCALGYEVLWTRVLSIVVGTTVYGYTTMLVAFLVGLAVGGATYRAMQKFLASSGKRAVCSFGVVQILIGVFALLVSYALQELPNHAFLIELKLESWFSSSTGTRQFTNFVLALLYMSAPAFLMGLAFPLAGDIVARSRGKVGRGIGETLAYNTVGAILGASVSGFILIYLFGIERSLQALTLLNFGIGFVVVLSLFKVRVLSICTALATSVFMVFLVSSPDFARVWDEKYFAIFNHNARWLLKTEQNRADIYESSEVLYFSEGVTSTISVFRIKGANQGLQVNGRTVASNSRQDQQCQYTLGHLPMLLHKNPEKVWVLGMGTGMTAGATSVHEEVESVTVVELEKHVVPAARTFAAYNHNFLDNPKVDVVFNDGRNFLLTTKERFDVLTADPIHPWSQGAAYLYTDEYYSLAASRLRPGGVMCQWLPIYELSPLDLQSVVKTFANNFKYVYVWLTDYDAELIGSNEPIEINIDTLQQRIDENPLVKADLQKVNMGSAAKFLSYCIMGPDGSRRFGQSAPLNTDNNLYLEFSAPDSKGKPELVATNIRSLTNFREDISPYLTGNTLPEAFGVDEAIFRRAVDYYDQAHLYHYQGKDHLPGYSRLLATIEENYPWYGPSQFLLQEHRIFQFRVPQLHDDIRITLLDPTGQPTDVTLSIVVSKVSPERAKLLIVDNQVRQIYTSFYIDSDAERMEQVIADHAEELLQIVESTYQQQQRDGRLPDKQITLQKIDLALGKYTKQLSL